MSLALMVVMALICTASARAQVYVGGTQSQIGASGSPWAGPVGVVSDSLGNLYVGECGGNKIIKVDAQTHTTSTYLSSANSINFGCIQFLAIDASNNLYIADQGNGRIIKWSIATNTMLASYPANNPFGIALDGSNNIYYSTNIKPNYIYRIPAGSPSGTSGTLLISDSTPSSTTSLTFDKNQNLYVSDSTGNTIYEYTAASGYNVSSRTVFLTASSPYGLYFNANGDAIVAEFGNNDVKQFLAPGYTSSIQLTPGITGAEGLGVDPAGNMYLTAWGGSTLTELSPQGAGVGTVSVNSTSTAIAVNFEVSAGTTIGSFKVVDEGVTNLEFQEQSPDSNPNLCTTGAYATTKACAINVTFNPTTPGIKHGAVLVLDNSGNVLATAYLTGEGTGPEVNFLPGTLNTMDLTSYTTALPKNPIAVAVDAAQNLYYTDYANKAVVKLHWSGSSYDYSQGVINSGLTQPQGLAIDGAGNLYVADGTGNRIVKILANGTGSGYNGTVSLGTTLSDPKGVAVDGSGNVFVANNSGNNVVEIPWTGSGYGADKVVASLPGAYPNSITVDNSGNLFVSVYTAGKIIEIPYRSGSYGSPVAIDSGYTNPWGVVTDSNGNLYTSDATVTGPVYEYPWNGASFGPRTQLFTVPNGLLSLAMDGAGNFFGAGNYNVYELNRNMVPTLSFSSSNVGAQSTDSPKTVSVTNVGNAALSISVPGAATNPSFPAGFASDAGSTCPTLSTSSSAGTLAANATCTIGVDFIPVVAGANSGNVVLTDNNLGVAGSTQNFPVSGTGIQNVLAIAYGTLPTPGILSGGNAGVAVTVDELTTGNTIFSSGTDTITLTVTGPGGYSQTYTQAAVGGVATFDLSAATLTTTGTYTYAASFGPLSATATEQVAAPTYTAPTQNVGTPTASQTATILLNSSFTLGSVSVVTQGATGQDFAESSGGTCTVSTAYTASQACTVNYTFTPTVPGERLGAILLYDNNGALVSTTYLSGKGVAPEAIVSYPKNGVVVASYGQSIGGVTVSSFTDAAIDGAGNIYAVDPGTSTLFKFTRTGPGAYTGSAVSLSGVSLYQPTMLAIDGAGVIYTDSGSTIQSIANGVVAHVNLGSYTLGSYAGGLAVDASGNLYVSDPANQRIVVVPANGSAPYLLPHFPAGDAPGSLTIDPGGTVIYYEKNSHSIKSVTATGTVSTVYTPPANTQINQLNLDVNGNVLWGDEYFGGYYSASQTGAANALPVSNPCGTHTFLQAGNGDYVASSSSCGNLIVYPGSTTSSLTFSPTVTGNTSSDSPKAATLYNMGNAPLNIAVPGTGSNPSVPSGFALDSSSTCSTVGTSGPAATLAAGSSCTLAVNFSPTTVGANSGSVIVTDDSQNMAGSAQTISLSGMALPPVTALGFGAAPASPVVAGGNAGVVMVDEVNSSNAVVTTAGDLITLTVTGPNGYSKTYTATAVSGVATFDLSGASLTTPGAYTYTATGATYTIASTQTVTKATPSITEGSSPNPVFIGTAVTYTATVTGTAPSAPTGSVTFYDGATALGTATLNGSGVAALTATPNTVATHAVKAVYSGDTLYNTATSNTVSELAEDFNVALASGSSNEINVLPGGTAVFNLVVTPVGGATFPAAINLTQTGGPAGATATLSASSVTAGAGATNFTLTVVSSKTPLAANQQPELGRKLAPLTLALLLLPLAGFRRFRKQWLRTLAVLLLLAGGLAATTGLSGCTTPSGYFGQAPKSFTYTVTGTSGSLTHSTSITLYIE